ncbi:hypothetical protein J1N35_004012 [Gossypium stocksii]|uniref:Uncharacterized protein n=1 Tax=Gossypium stocksii TaxID=47602 RepID=A0A9D3WBC7_9ROSI|nr:hypothetical protein J1N35_004012 [Gossypium stocksii]
MQDTSYPFWCHTPHPQLSGNRRQTSCCQNCFVGLNVSNQDVCIATIEATLNSGLVMVTLFPNFTMSLHDPNLLTALKVQIQIIGAPQIASSIIATLHSQIVYRVQDHAFNLSNHVPDPKERHIPNDPKCCCGLCEPGVEIKLIESFIADGKPQYMFKDPKIGHYPWALNCSCELYADDRFTAWIDSLDQEAFKHSKRKTKKKSSQDEFYERYMNEDSFIGPLGEDNGKFLYIVDYSAKLPQSQTYPINPKPSPPPKSSSPPSFKRDTNSKKTFFPQPCYKQIHKWVQKNPFPETTKIPEPTPEFTQQGYSHNPKIPTKLQADESSKPVKVSAAEATLN